MYQSGQYLEIAGRLVASPYAEDDSMHGVNLHDLICTLHASGASRLSDFETIVFSAIESGSDLTDLDKINLIFNRLMDDLNKQGVRLQN